MGGVQYVTDDKGRKTAVLIDLKKHGAIWEDFWDGFVSESRRREKSVLDDRYRASRLKRAAPPQHRLTRWAGRRLTNQFAVGAKPRQTQSAGIRPSVNDRTGVTQGQL